MPKPVNPESVELEYRGSVYIIRIGTKPLMTPKGKIVSSIDNRLLDHIRSDIQLTRKLDVNVLCPYSLYATQKDYIEQGEDDLTNHLVHLLSHHDPLLKRSAGPEQVDQMHQWASAITFLDEYGMTLPVVVSKRPPEEFTALIRRTYLRLTSAQKSGITALCSIHHAGILLPLMLLMKRCTAVEYANGILAAHGVHANIFEPTWTVHATDFEGFKQDANTVLDYASAASGHDTIASPMAFISHDVGDKAKIALPLASELERIGCHVWYDDYSLVVGASVIKQIERGLMECAKCIVIVTPRYLSNQGWAKKEFDIVFSREMISRENVIVPIWSDVREQDVRQYSPALADCGAINWTTGCKKVATELKRTLFHRQES